MRMAVYGLLVAIAVGGAVARISTVRSKLGGTPLLGANDRSRWSTIRALVDHGTYELDQVIFLPDGKRDREWYTIDLVKHRGADGKEHYYSSKPPLLATILAAEYWVLNRAFGAQIAVDTVYVVRGMLVLTNVGALLLFWWLVVQMIERYAQSGAGRIYVLAAATLGTLLTTFAVALNNHVPAAVCTAATAYALLRIFADQRREARYFVIAGLGSALAVANELPAAMLLVLAAIVCFAAAPRRAVWAFAVPAAIVLVAYFGTNYLAHQSWRPPYSHRHDGSVLGYVAAGAPASEKKQPLPADLRRGLEQELQIAMSASSELAPRESNGQWMAWDSQSQQRLAMSFQNGRWEIRDWDNWYEYERSYWQDKNKVGVDRGEPSRAVYAFHTLLGHHGVFSLTPVWILALWGAAIWIRRGPGPQRWATLAIVAMTLVCVVFYIARPEHDRNYGGVSCGFRWLFWLIPLWLFCLIPAADRASQHRGLWYLAIFCLAVSVFSAAYAATNPWSHPWLFDYWTALGWIQY
jgi:hypothetical protein